MYGNHVILLPKILAKFFMSFFNFYSDKRRVRRVGPDRTREHNDITWNDMELTFAKVFCRGQKIGKE